MGKKKKDTMELRFYEVPQGEYVLAILDRKSTRQNSSHGVQSRMPSSA